ncbi:hypothetical protein [Pseudanabaena sp. BC1403]|nr:hypothetical protein [Pseudanabaena sp. BC1403]
MTTRLQEWISGWQLTNLLKAANLSDIGIDLDALLGKKTNESRV